MTTVGMTPRKKTRMSLRRPDPSVRGEKKLVSKLSLEMTKFWAFCLSDDNQHLSVNSQKKIIREKKCLLRKNLAKKTYRKKILP